MSVLLPLITLILGFAASYLLEILRNRWTAQSTREIRDAERQQASLLDRVAFERDGLRAMHASIQNLMNAINTIAIAQGKAEAAGKDWRDGDTGQELRAAGMHANARCSHDAALLLHPPVIEAVDRLTTVAFPMYWTRESGMDSKNCSDFYGALTSATRAIAARVRDLYGFTASSA